MTAPTELKSLRAQLTSDNEDIYVDMIKRSFTEAVRVFADLSPWILLAWSHDGSSLVIRTPTRLGNPDTLAFSRVPAAISDSSSYCSLVHYYSLTNDSVLCNHLARYFLTMRQETIRTKLLE